MSKRENRWSRALWTLVHLGLAAVFVYAGWMKLLDPVSLADAIARFRLLPDAVIPPMALGLPPFEILCGVAMLIESQRRPAALGIASLCLMFLVALASAAARGIRVDCNCFGSAEAESISTAIVRDIVLLIAASACYVREVRRRNHSVSSELGPEGALNETA